MKPVKITYILDITENTNDLDAYIYDICGTWEGSLDCDIVNREIDTTEYDTCNLDLLNFGSDLGEEEKLGIIKKQKLQEYHRQIKVIEEKINEL